MPDLTLKTIIIRLAIIISLTELVIMLGLAIIPHDFGILAEAIIDVILLIIIASPIFYLWIIKPFIHSRDEAITKLTNMAFTDQLTGLPNRHYLIKELEKFISESVRHKFYGALILIDLDDFKPINDSYGHSAGDAVLIELAKRLQANIRLEDVASRVGGDEFVVLLNQLKGDALIASKEAVSLANKLQNILNKPIRYQDKELHVGSSFGIRLLGVDFISVDDAIKEADTAMYKAKQQGKGQVILFGKNND